MFSSHSYWLHQYLAFFITVELAVEEIRRGQLQNSMSAIFRPTSLGTKSPLEEQASQALTPFAFKMFQEELKRASQYMLLQVEGYTYTIRYYEGVNYKKHKVFWDGNIAFCSCKNFEFWGILCRHAIRVLLHTDCFKIPIVYLPLVF